SRGRASRLSQRARGRLSEKRAGAARLCGAGSAAVRIGRRSGGASRESRRARDCLSFLRSFYPRPRPRDTYGFGASPGNRNYTCAPLRDFASPSVRPVSANVSHRNSREVAKSHMKLPAVAVAAFFSGGILLGLQPVVARHATSKHFLAALIVFLLGCLLPTILLTRREKLWLAASFSLAAWVVLGVFAACLAEQPLPPEHVLSRMAAGQISSKVPLRYVGRLRNEVSRLPWGYGLELDLTRVESAAGALPLRGGMRLGFTPKDGEPALPELHAGDEIAVLTTARLPLVYKDAGAFDRREFLAQQNIHVQATLRASTLLQKIGAPTPSLETRLARWRGTLRDELDALFPASPEVAGILRAMLLGDRAFIDWTESLDFQKTGVFHVLVVAGLHVGALAFFLFWLTRRL